MNESSLKEDVSRAFSCGTERVSVVFQEPSDRANVVVVIEVVVVLVT